MMGKLTSKPETHFAMKLHTLANVIVYLCVPISQGYRSMTLLATQEQFGRHRFSLDKPTIQSGLGIIWKLIYHLPCYSSLKEIVYLNCSVYPMGYCRDTLCFSNEKL